MNGFPHTVGAISKTGVWFDFQSINLRALVRISIPTRVRSSRKHNLGDRIFRARERRHRQRYTVFRRIAGTEHPVGYGFAIPRRRVRTNVAGWIISGKLSRSNCSRTAAGEFSVRALFSSFSRAPNTCEHRRDIFPREVLVAVIFNGLCRIANANTWSCTCYRQHDNSLANEHARECFRYSISRGKNTLPRIDRKVFC